MRSPLSDFAWKLMIVGLLLILAGFVWGAPAPLPKREKPNATRMDGSYEMTWGNSLWHVRLFEDGRYRAQADDNLTQIWHGTWKFDRTTRTLSVHEKCLSSGTDLRWEAPLDAALSGSVGSFGVAVKLVKRR